MHADDAFGAARHCAEDGVEIEEVLLARIAGGAHCASSAREKWRASFRGVRSPPRSPDRRRATRSPERHDSFEDSARVAASIRPFSTLRSRFLAIPATPRAMSSGVRSFKRTAWPLAAATCAMPEPIWPAPTTAIFKTTSFQRQPTRTSSASPLATARTNRGDSVAAAALAELV